MTAAPTPPTILLVDDDHGLVILIEKALRAENWNVAAATSGADALAWLQQHSADLLLLDLKLHDMEGRQFIGALADAGRSFPFVVITGQGDERVAVEMMKRGALDYLVKDVNFIEFIPTVVRRALERLADERKLAEAEAAAIQSRSLTQAVLNSLTAHIAVLDQWGNIIAVNEAWNRFARDNDDCRDCRDHRNHPAKTAGVGANYLEICRRAVGKEEAGALEVLAGIQAVIDRSRTHFSIEYPCHSPREERWFLMTVTPLISNGGGVVISHTDITRPKQAEDALQEQQRRYQSLVEMSPDAIFVTQHDRVNLINAAGLRLFGADDPAQVLGKSPFQFFHPGRHAVIREWIDHLLGGGGPAPLLEEKLVRLDGVVRSVEVLAATFPQGADSAIQVVVRDITDRKRDEVRRHLLYETSRLLAASDSLAATIPRLLQTLAEALQWNVGEFWEPSGRDGSLRVVHVWHAPGKKLANFVKRSLRLSISMFDGFPGQVMATRKPHWIPEIAQCPYFLRKPEAARAGLRSALAFPILLDQELLGVMAFLTHPATDPDEGLLEMFVTLGHPIGQFMERKRVEEALRISEQRLRSTLDNMMEGCHTVGFDWRYLYVNEAAARHGRRAISELLGRTMKEVYPGSEKTRLFAQLQECMKNRSTSHVEDEFIYPDGESAWFQLSIQPVPEGLFILSLDITERKKLERELLDLSERKQREFGHDLHDGLGQRLTGLEMLSHGLAEDLKGRASALAKQARRLNLELRETVTQARLMSHSLAPVPLEGDGLMRGLIELAASTSRIAGVACRFVCDPPVCIQDVTTATHLYRIAQEAVNNALKHGEPRTIEIVLVERAGGLELTIKNDGRVIPPPTRATGGMGLHIMRYRAAMIGASLSIESGKRKGVWVTCTLRRKI